MTRACTITGTASIRACAAVAAVAVVAGCSDGGATRPEPRPAPHAISVVQGAGQEAEVATELPQPLVVQVHDAEGAPVSGATVEWRSGRGAPPLASTTDGEGRASTRWTLSMIAGPDTVVARVQGTGVDTRIGVHGWPGPPARVTAPDSISMFFYEPGLAVQASAADRFGNAVPTSGIWWAALDPAYAKVQLQGEQVRVVPVSPGRARMVASLGMLADTMIATVMHDVTFLDVRPFRLRAMVGDSLMFSALGLGPDFVVREAPVTWAVDGSVISLVPHGERRAVVRALAPGRASVEARMVWAQPLSRTVVIEVVASSDWTSLSGGAGHQCGVTARGLAFCWGANLNEFTGTETGDYCRTGACNTTPMPVRGGLRFSSVAAGPRTTCGITTDGGAFCWGGNTFGEMGNGTTDQFTLSEPEPVTGNVRFASLTLGDIHSCGLDVQGRAYCWGGNRDGQVGVPGAPAPANPVPLPVAGGLTFRRLDAGGYRTCGITTAGETYCWGQYIANAPTRVQGPAFSELTVGQEHMCGLTPAGEAWCWGLNRTGELGLGRVELSQHAVPQRVLGGHRFVSIAAGERYTCAVDDAGAAWCWGKDREGVLGNGGADVPAATPSRVATSRAFRSVTAAGDHACAVTADGSAFCWGDGGFGRLGNGTYDASSVPVRVSVP